MVDDRRQWRHACPPAPAGSAIWLNLYARARYCCLQVNAAKTWEPSVPEDSRQGSSRGIAGIDITRPNGARVYDYFLGGKDNFTADRAFANTILECAPKAPLGAQAGREFLRRVVRYLAAEAGISQFLDIGSGLPTQGNVSEVAHEINPEAHVVYVDNDTMVYTHSMALLSDATRVEVINADIRDPARILTDPTVRSLIDFDKPVGLLMLAVLHHIDDHDDPASIAATFRDAMPAGSYLAISSFRMPGAEAPELQAVTVENEKIVTSGFGSARWRDEEEIRGWFGDWELVWPGLVSLADWRPDERTHTERDEIYHSFFGGVARRINRLLAGAISLPSSVRLPLLGKEMSLRARQPSAVHVDINLLRVEGD
jgi:hypothetical protein